MDFDGEAFGKGIVTAVKDHINGAIAPLQVQIDQVRAALLEQKPEDLSAPLEVIDEISKAIALLAEAPPLQQKHDTPVVVNFTPAAGKKIKTITTRRDDKGNLVARVVEDAD